jgi:hypothetical protein
MNGQRWTMLAISRKKKVKFHFYARVDPTKITKFKQVVKIFQFLTNQIFSNFIEKFKEVYKPWRRPYQPSRKKTLIHRSAFLRRQKKTYFAFVHIFSYKQLRSTPRPYNVPLPKEGLYGHKLKKSLNKVTTS